MFQNDNSVEQAKGRKSFIAILKGSKAVEDVHVRIISRYEGLSTQMAGRLPARGYFRY